METTVFEPLVRLDLNHATAKTLRETMEEFYRLVREQGKTCRCDLTTGWHDITPQIAEDLLVSQANRKISLETLKYYARQMKAGEWKRTGQPILIDVNGAMRDAFHRAWACYLGMVGFPSFVVTDVPAIDNLFAYIDNSKTRTASDALYTAGLNGVSNVLAATIKMAANYAAGSYTPRGTMGVGKLSPIEVLHLAEANPRMREVVLDVVGEHHNALDLFANKDVVCFIAWKIAELHGDEVREEFLSLIEDVDPSHPVIVLLRKRLKGNLVAEKRLPKRDVLAFAIMAFNAWHTGRTIRSLKLATDDPFPRFAGEDDADQLAA